MSSFCVKRIAIIGAGPAGLSAARYLIHQQAFESIVIFEQQAEVGGVWNYSKEPSKITRAPQTDPLSPPDPPVLPKDDKEAPIFPTPMYDDLNTNIPHSLMNFSDLPFPEGSIIFPPRQAVQSYLLTYSEPLRNIIRLCTKVNNVRLFKGDTGHDKWEVDSQHTVSAAVESETFDAVVVASGHYALPYVPRMKGIAEFHARYPGIISHSKTYRDNSPFIGKQTVVVGNAASGLDIARQINTVCHKPLLISAQHPAPQPQLEHTGGQEVPEIEEFLLEGPPAVRFKNGQVEQVDAVLFCTGYLFSFPFLDNTMLGDPPVVNTGRRVQGLYRHIFHIRHPTIVFPGLPIKAVPFPVCEGQAAVISRVWSNHLSLPPVPEMREWEKKELEIRGEAMHVFPSGGDIDYINSMHEWAMEATESKGKKPPIWEGELIWERNTYKNAKLAFEKQGRSAKSLTEIGFGYDPNAPILVSNF
ncbi:FAD/NAD(P)-binding domain-containing protein [Zalerion maritima]|uniref:FAD/NAD(P)-binding domain-containing protein n=1 Tax=Zalerion maritima TaxID=339359 RepID=A0AAD5RNJ2_9PEZI|nr:FAD/NAD(P)-binding domain-containing protein [Zalerion maritima]